MTALALQSTVNNLDPEKQSSEIIVVQSFALNVIELSTHSAGHCRLYIINPDRVTSTGVHVTDVNWP